MSELACSFLMMSFECLCWRPHLLGFPPWAELLANEGTRPLPWAELLANGSTPPRPWPSYRRTRPLDPQPRSSVSRVSALSFGGNPELPANERSRPPSLGRVTGEREH